MNKVLSGVLSIIMLVTLSGFSSTIEKKEINNSQETEKTETVDTVNGTLDNSDKQEEEDNLKNEAEEQPAVTKKIVVIDPGHSGFNWSKVPVVLVEMGFMSNKEEDQLLNDDSYQEKLAEGLCKGILESLHG